MGDRWIGTGWGGALLLMIIVAFLIWPRLGSDGVRLSTWRPQDTIAQVGLTARQPAGLSGFASQQGRGLGSDPPQGNPLQAPNAVVTQGYGVGTHAPAAIWGAVDLAVDGDGDGYAEPGASWYAPVVATHDGNVRVTLDSYPGGNHVWVMEPGGVWRTGYAHLALVMVTSGQFVRAGEVIGLLGNTGLASGPHLDYQVWRGDTNLDPTWLVGCG